MSDKIPPPTQPLQNTYAQQPQGTPMMTIGGAATGLGGNRNSLNKPVKPSGQRDWSFGICDCFSACQTCFFAWCCPCLAYGKNSSRLRHLDTQGAIHPAGGDMCNVECLTYGALLYAGCPCFVHMGLRRDIRQRYNIEGSGGSDFWCTWCCVPCALTQESREIGLEEQSLTTGHYA